MVASGLKRKLGRGNTKHGAKNKIKLPVVSVPAPTNAKRWIFFFTSVDYLLKGKEKMPSFNSHTQIGSDNVTAKNTYLKNQDLMAMTFSYLQGNDECLLNAALTCKYFLDVALDKLWEKMDSLVPVLKLLPALQFENDIYVCANVFVFLYDLTLLLGP